MPRKFVLLHFLDPSHICPPPISLSIALEEPDCKNFTRLQLCPSKGENTVYKEQASLN